MTALLTMAVLILAAICALLAIVVVRHTRELRRQDDALVALTKLVDALDAEADVR